jgi:VWFA-related protein
MTLAALLPQEPAPPVVTGTVTAERVRVDTRVLHRGRPVRGLGPEHFRARIDGSPAEVVSATWVSGEGAAPTEAEADERAPGGRRLPAQRRLIVLFFQKELHPTRTGGLLRLLDEARRLLPGLGPEDRAAVLSFDSHLTLWCDFTSNVEALERALEHDVVFESRARYLGIGPDPSLTAHLGLEDARRAATPETALRLIADALGEIEGSKTLVVFGHGFGQLSGPRVTVHRDYDEALQTLLEAEVTVFSLDVTDADRHSLEVGLQEVARETGGFYARTHIFSKQAVSRLQAALDGHYILEVVPPEARRGRHVLRVALRGVDGDVYARRAYYD